MALNRETQHIIDFVTASQCNYPLEDQLPIIKELYQTAIDNYTFSKELEWYFTASINTKALLYNISHTKKSEFLSKVNWVWVARYYIHLFKDDQDLHYSQVLSSYHHQKYLKDPIMHDSGRYEFNKREFAKKDYIISLKAPEKIGERTW